MLTKRNAIQKAQRYASYNWKYKYNWMKKQYIKNVCGVSMLFGFVFWVKKKIQRNWRIPFPNYYSRRCAKTTLALKSCAQIRWEVFVLFPTHCVVFSFLFNTTTTTKKTPPRPNVWTKDPLALLKPSLFLSRERERKKIHYKEL